MNFTKGTIQPHTFRVWLLGFFLIEVSVCFFIFRLEHMAYSTCLFLFRITVVFKSLTQLSLGKRQDDTLDWLPVNPSTTYGQTAIVIHTHSKGKFAVNYTNLCFWIRGKLEYLEKSSTSTERTCKLHTVGFLLGTF